MPAESNSSSFVFDESVAGLLACPACLGDLSAEESRLVCTACGRSYLVVDGIPVLIAERVTVPRPEIRQADCGKTQEFPKRARISGILPKNASGQAHQPLDRGLSKCR